MPSRSVIWQPSWPDWYETPRMSCSTTEHHYFGIQLNPAISNSQGKQKIVQNCRWKMNKRQIQGKWFCVRNNGPFDFDLAGSNCMFWSTIQAWPSFLYYLVLGKGNLRKPQELHNLLFSEDRVSLCSSFWVSCCCELHFLKVRAFHFFTTTKHSGK